MEVSGPEDDLLLAQLHRSAVPRVPAGHARRAHQRAPGPLHLLLHPAGLAEPAQPRASGAGRPSSALKQPATPTAAESSEGEAEPDDGGESENRESDDAPPTPSGARLLPDFPGARPGSPGGKGARPRPAAAAAAGGASPRSWGEAEAPEEEAAGDADGGDDAGRWDADPNAAAFRAPGGCRARQRPEEVRQLLEGSRWPTPCAPTRCRTSWDRAAPWGPKRCCARCSRPARCPRSSCGGHRAAARSARRPGPLRGEMGGPIRAREASTPPSPLAVSERDSRERTGGGAVSHSGVCPFSFWKKKKKKCKKCYRFCCGMPCVWLLGLLFIVSFIADSSLSNLETVLA